MEHKALEVFLKESKIKYKVNEPMREHTSFKTGGPADYYITVSSAEELNRLLSKLKETGTPYFILGKGSNLLVSDRGIEGAVISLSELNGITVNGNEITAGAGVSLAAVCITAQKNSLCGMEFAYGIPASVGGALYMNAGAYGGEMSHIVARAEYIAEDGSIKTAYPEDMRLGYRTSIFKSNGAVITSVTFKLDFGDGCEIREKMDCFMERRRSKQPLEYPSAGSTFKRPEGYFAGALIEKNKLKGVSVGGAQVSQKHAGFIINFNNATSDDVKNLMKKVSDTVFEADGVRLEPEVIFVGRD